MKTDYFQISMLLKYQSEMMIVSEPMAVAEHLPRARKLEINNRHANFISLRLLGSYNIVKTFVHNGEQIQSYTGSMVHLSCNDGHLRKWESRDSHSHQGMWCLLSSLFPVGPELWLSWGSSVHSSSTHVLMPDGVGPLKHTEGEGRWQTLTLLLEAGPPRSRHEGTVKEQE